MPAHQGAQVLEHCWWAGGFADSRQMIFDGPIRLGVLPPAKALLLFWPAPGYKQWQGLPLVLLPANF
jgi:hypothetical protein